MSQQDLISRTKARRYELLAELKRIDAFLATAAAVRPKLMGTRTGTPERPRTVQLLERSLAGGERLHLDDILNKMLTLGWRSSGDRMRDYRTLHALLSRHKQLYRNVGNAVFEAIPKERVALQNNNDSKTGRE